MTRRLFNLATFVSLVLFVTTLALWFRGFWALDDLKYRQPNLELVLASARGSIGLRTLTPSIPQTTWSPHLGLEATPPQPLLPDGHPGWRPLGFGYMHYIDTFADVRRFVVPCWFVAILTLLLPATWMLTRLTGRRRSSQNLCPNCGYDLRATPDRCPECGAIPQPRAAAPLQ
jgi:hypothetical protein